ncbi:nitronate monooxygenase [Streptomyces olivaceoviridis]
MQTELSGKLGIGHAVFGFTPFPAVAAAIRRAGGFGVLGAVRYTAPDDLQRDLDWLDAHAGGRPYGLDVVMPANKAEGVTEADVEAMIPEEHRRFVRDTLAAHGVPEPAEGEASGWRITGWMEQVARTQLDVALDYPIRLLANALGSPPADVVERAHDRDILVAALAGSARHARKHREAGIDVVVAQGYEAGGHTGEIATMVLPPEVVEAVDLSPVLAAGGIGSGPQVAAALTLGAQGVWLGSIWLTTIEADLHSPALPRKLLAAGSGDTVPSRALTGKPARRLRTEWTSGGCGTPTGRAAHAPCETGVVPPHGGRDHRRAGGSVFAPDRTRSARSASQHRGGNQRLVCRPVRVRAARVLDPPRRRTQDREP